MHTPFVLSDGTFGLQIDVDGLRGKGVPQLISPSELGWPRLLPEPMMEGGAFSVVFLRRGEKHQVGRATVARKGKRGEAFRLLVVLDRAMPEPLWQELHAIAIAPPPPDPVERIVALAQTSTTAERMAALTQFLERWFGVRGPAVDDSYPGPPPLRTLHGLLGSATSRVFLQNRLPSAPSLDNGRLVFYVENQGVYTWATDMGGADPLVYALGQGDWEPEGSPLSAFLIGAVLLEAVFQAPWGANQQGLSTRELARLQKRLPPFPIPAWKASGTQFFGGGGVIGVAMGKGEPGDRDVWLAAVDHMAFEPVASLLADWPDACIGP